MRRLNTVSMGIKNLLRQKGRTSIMIIFSFVLTMSLFVCTIVTESMQQSVDKTINRMGADIIVVPEEYETEYTESLFSGELCTFYFEKEWYEKVCTIEGIKVASPQLYLASLSASCCVAPIQLIAFDPETLVSTIMIRAEEGIDIKALARKINFGIDDCPLNAYTTDGITSSITASVDSFAMFSNVLNILLFLMAVLAIVCIFTITILQRKSLVS